MDRVPNVQFSLMIFPNRKALQLLSPVPLTRHRPEQRYGVGLAMIKGLPLVEIITRTR